MSIPRVLSIIGIIFCLVSLSIPWVEIKTPIFNIRPNLLQFIYSPITIGSLPGMTGTQIQSLMDFLKILALTMEASFFAIVVAIVFGVISLIKKNAAIGASILCIFSFIMSYVGFSRIESVYIANYQFGAFPSYGIALILISALTFIVAPFAKEEVITKPQEVSQEKSTIKAEIAEPPTVSKQKASVTPTTTEPPEKQDWVFCIKCGSRNPSEGVYCFKCGSKLFKKEESQIIK